MLGLGSNLTKGGAGAKTIVTDSLVLKHNYALSPVQPLSDGAASFDGTDDYISVSDAASLSFGDASADSAFSISAWVFMKDATSFMIMGKGVAGSDHEWLMYVTGADKIALYTYDESASSYVGRTHNTALTTYENTWVHFAGTYDATEANSGFKIYLNGVQVDDTDFGSGSYTATEAGSSNVHIGRYNANYADGYICNAGIWDAVLSQPQIKSIMNKNYAGLTSSEKEDLVSWWNLSADANDNHGSNNGTLS